ncbi:MAG: hypothetical protein H7X80_09765, partial [bacterium]|nr:hypothetical protein [Candidatus Kapabacteria bacterium]
MRLFCLLILLALAPIQLWSQGTVFEVSPSVLYPGRNVVTVKAHAGIDRINILAATPNLSVDGDGSLDCAKSAELEVELARADQTAVLSFELIDCRGRREKIDLAINTVWNLETRDFGEVQPGKRVCMMFYIRTQDQANTLDTVTVPDPRVTLHFFTDLPYRIRVGETYQYEACFQYDEPGIHKFPVITWMRRDSPSGGLTTYPVADTGIVYIPEMVEAPATDPTTFRSVVVPNAVVPPQGTLTFGTYDVLGLVASYSVTDNVMINGGVVLPLPDDWVTLHGESSTAMSVGVKFGLPVSDNVDVAAGYQVSTSIYRKDSPPNIYRSEIFVQSPFASISYGDDDSRASLTLGYAFKHHKTTETEFDENA